MADARISKKTITEALNRLYDRTIPASLSDNSYLRGYLALLELFQSLDLHSHRQVWSGAYAVYGWMPTILSRLPTASDTSNLRRLIEAGREEGATLNLNAWKSTIQSINNSVVGTSKFLHFSAPEIFPIWDSVVARAFGLSHPHQYARPEHYIAYFEAVHTWLLDSDCVLPENFSVALKPMDEGLGAVRKLELALFWEGNMRK